MGSRSSCDILCQILDVPSKYLVITLVKRRGEKLERVMSL